MSAMVMTRGADIRRDACAEDEDNSSISRRSVVGVCLIAPSLFRWQSTTVMYQPRGRIRDICIINGRGTVRSSYDNSGSELRLIRERDSTSLMTANDFSITITAPRQNVWHGEVHIAMFHTSDILCH